jgi:hypothetical protein
MIIDKYIKIKLNSQNIKYYINLGYIAKVGQEVSVLIRDLSNGSNYKIKVKCDICSNIKDLTYHKYIKNITNGGFYSCSNKCSMIKYKNKMLETYGVENIFQLENIKEKSKNTKTKKYCDKNYNNIDKAIETKKNKKNLEDSLTNNDWIMYKKLSRRIFRKVKKEIFNKWDGFDFYDNEYIKDNLKLKFYDKNYPTIDHKISVYEGFLNNIPVEIINSVENLVVTKRYINSIKGYKKIKPTI